MSVRIHRLNTVNHCLPEKGKRKVKVLPHSQAAAHPRHKDEEETDKIKQAQIEQNTKNAKISSLFPKRGNHLSDSTNWATVTIESCNTYIAQLYKVMSDVIRRDGDGTRL